MCLSSVFMGLTAFQPQSEPKATPCFHRVVGKRPARSRTDCCPVPQIIPYSFTLARKIRFRNRIPTAGAWGVSVLITTLSLWFSLTGRNGFYLSEEPQAKNGLVARVAQRRGLSQGRQKGVYFRLNDRSKSWGDFTDFWESELLPRVVRIIRHAGESLSSLAE